MKIITKELLNKLDILKTIVNDNDFSDLANKFYFKNNKIITYDGKTFISVSFENDLGVFSIAQNEFYKVISKLKNKEIILLKQKNKLIIKTQKLNIELTTNDEVKEMDFICRKKYKKLPNDFNTAINLTKFCINKNGVDSSAYLTIKDNCVYATDKYRICRYIFEDKINDMLLPSFCLYILAKLNVTQYSENEKFYFFKNNNDFEFGVLKNNLDELDFSKYQMIFEDNDKNNIIISLPQEIKHNIEMSEIFTDQISITQKEIEFIFKKNKIICKAKSEKGVIETKIKYENNLDLSFFIHPLFLLEILKVCNVMELKDDIVIFRNEIFCYFFRVRL